MATLNKRLTVIALAIALTGCQSTPESSVVEQSLKEQLAQQIAHEQAAQAKQQAEPGALTEVPDSVTDLLGDVNTSAERPSLFGPEKYDIEADGVSVKAFFTGLVADTPYSVAIHPEVSGDISLSLKQVTMEQVMELLGDLYGYDISRKSNVFRVLPAGMRTETLAVNYLLMKRDGSTQTSIISGGVSQADSNGSGSSNSSFNNFSGNSANSNNLGNQFGNNANGTSISTRTETDFWSDLKTSLESMIGSDGGRAVFVTPQAGLVTIRAMPDEIRDIKRFLKTSEASLQRQVILEARILEVSLDDGYQQGINWSEVVANSGGSTEFSFSNTAGSIGNQISASLGGVTSLSFLNKDFSGVISLLSTQGNVQVLSSPRVTAINNQKAVIKVGDDEYFVTDVSSQNTITSTTTSVVPNIELTPFFSGIALDVTPQIDESGSVLLHVHPSVIETQEQEKVVSLNQEQIVLPLAQSTIRESDTIIKAASGEIVVIGGLMQTSITDSESKTPLLGDIPLLGELFTNKSQRETKKELIILLKPTVIGSGTWAEQIELSREKMADWLYVE
ncbi:pilus (MSHA type) biogenesis protein MshL [Alteromonas lipolytica]|uniref:Pilus (MSHA type) biogenesis protein MshL n=1 Tax=Alteromonas lipolytica TaxID=1856405 RepID=A0A1E8F8L0_9ALTE|nr:pilus (MSHA type) biogenesis protein MshL [Alteromonas lipolytica]OFI32252.1 pilus (MSHA type) biogenesis protein MshL [Alteromonas lipolytica]GGF82855.1 pilus (MSHA type) biogenesis protein MshL [Alteromonas lipolytica]